MATIQHEDITDPKIHEPKGASTASANTVYVADGAGSGTWKQVPVDALDEATILADIQSNLDDGTTTLTVKGYLSGVIADISTASSVLIPLIKDCTVKQVYLVLGGAIATADASVSLKNAAGSSMGTPATVAFTSSAKGDDYTITCDANNVLTGPTYIELATDGGSDNVVPLYYTVEYTYVANTAD